MSRDYEICTGLYKVADVLTLNIMRLCKDSIDPLMDCPISLQCPHCNVISLLTVISVPNYDLVMRFHPTTVGIVYRCNSCGEPVFLKFSLTYLSGGGIELSKEYQIVEFPKENFEFKYLPEAVRQDFVEALDCYSIGAYNGFAALCRRTIQSTASCLGVKGTDKVKKQVVELKEIAEMEEDDYAILNQIILDGHDGAHPHLPSITVERAKILLELMKDIMYELFVRKGKIEDAKKLRQEQIDKK